jgi:hypothetical protein
MDKKVKEWKNFCLKCLEIAIEEEEDSELYKVATIPIYEKDALKLELSQIFLKEKGRDLHEMIGEDHILHSFSNEQYNWYLDQCSPSAKKASKQMEKEFRFRALCSLGYTPEVDFTTDKDGNITLSEETEKDIAKFSPYDKWLEWIKHGSID